MVRWWILMSALQDLEPWRTHRWGCLEGIFRDVCWSREDPLSTYGEHYPVIWNKMGKAGRQPGASIYFSLPGYLIVSPPPLPRWILAPWREKNHHQNEQSKILLPLGVLTTAASVANRTILEVATAEAFSPWPVWPLRVQWGGKHTWEAWVARVSEDLFIKCGGVPTQAAERAPSTALTT